MGLMKDPDNGLLVPLVLLILKDLLQILDGPKSEGIFRKAGLESEMTIIKEHFNEGSPFSCDNQHTIATLLKRWYKALPTRLLADVDREDESDEFAMKYPTFLSNMGTRLASWLIDLLLDVVEHQETNLMDPKNCAIVWGPGMTGSSDEKTLTGSPLDMGAMAGFSDTRFGINFIQANVAHYHNTKTKPFGISDKNLEGSAAKCILDHPRNVMGELELKAGEIVIVVDASHPEWSFVNNNGKYGFVAKICLKETNEKPDIAPIPMNQLSANPRRATYDPNINSRNSPSNSGGSVKSMLSRKITSSGNTVSPPVPPKRNSNN